MLLQHVKIRKTLVYPGLYFLTLVGSLPIKIRIKGVSSLLSLRVLPDFGFALFNFLLSPPPSFAATTFETRMGTDRLTSYRGENN